MLPDRSKGTIYEVAKRYTCCLYALSDILGIDPYTVLKNHREVVSNIFQQASREGIKIANDVRVPRLHKILVSDTSEKERVA